MVASGGGFSGGDSASRDDSDGQGHTDSSFDANAPVSPPADQPTLFGHPTGLFTLFFAEMWERFSYYGMRALLILYMIKGFLQFDDKNATAVYGAYTALVYMTPFFGGMIADRLLGARTTVVLGGLLMATGHLLMTIQKEFWFFTALGFLIAGNGFFKPNISSIVGSLYPQGSPKRDGGFTIFYIGINLGAAMSPILCGYIGETYGWHYGFGLATIGMLVGLAVFVAPNFITQLLIGLTALASAIGMIMYNAGDLVSVMSISFIIPALLIAATVAVLALGRGGLPRTAGMAPDPANWSRNLLFVMLGTICVLPIFVILVSGMSILPGFDKQVIVIPESFTTPLEESESKLVRGLAEFVKEASRPAGLILIVAGIGAAIFLARETFRMGKVARERMYVVFILTFFSMLFWAFFEQSGSSVNNFTDRNVDRVAEEKLVEASEVGVTVQLDILSGGEGTEGAYYLSQEFLGRENASDISSQLELAVRTVELSKEPEKRLSDEDLAKRINEVVSAKAFNMTSLSYLREAAKEASVAEKFKQIPWTFAEENVGKVGLGGSEIPASVFQAVNAIFIMLFGLIFTALWDYMGRKGVEPSAPVKFSLGLLQLALGFGMLYFGAQVSSDGMVGVSWLVLMYLLLTTGELCLSPVGLSMITKLSPARLVSTVMGAWFLATAFSQFLAAIIAQFAAVTESGIIPPPAATVHVYGEVFRLIAIMAGVSGVVCLMLSPLLYRWMHVGVLTDDSATSHAH